MTIPATIHTNMTKAEARVLEALLRRTPTPDEERRLYEAAFGAAVEAAEPPVGGNDFPATDLRKDGRKRGPQHQPSPVGKVAKTLGVSRPTARKKLKEYGLHDGSKPKVAASLSDDPNTDSPAILIAGARRLAAAKALGWEWIECQVHVNMTDEEAERLEIIENLHRQNLTGPERKAHFKWLASYYKEVDEEGKPRHDVGVSGKGGRGVELSNKCSTITPQEGEAESRNTKIAKATGLTPQHVNRILKEAEAIEIVENLHRKELTSAERKTQIKRLAALYEAGASSGNKVPLESLSPMSGPSKRPCWRIWFRPATGQNPRVAPRVGLD